MCITFKGVSGLKNYDIIVMKSATAQRRLRGATFLFNYIGSFRLFIQYNASWKILKRSKPKQEVGLKEHICKP